MWPLIILTLALRASAVLDIAQNVCDFGAEKELKCFTQTLQSDINQADVLGDIEKLSIECSDAFFYESVLSPQHLGRLPQLQQLQLEYCKIRQIPADAFQGLEALTHLTINSHNSEWSSILLDMNKDSFAGLTHLQSLDLSYNNVWSLPLGSLCHLNQLTSLNMSRNHLLDLGDLGLGEKLTCGLEQIEAIDVSRNFISSLRPNDLKMMRSLKRLNLAHNRLTYISDEALYDMTSLQVLKLADNQLAALPPAVFNKSGQLQELHLQNNSLTLVTPELFSGLSNLVLLNLSHNAIASHLLSLDTFGGLHNLKVLDLSHNRITHLDPLLLKPLVNLEVLILDHNMISQFKTDLVALTKLSLAENSIQHFQPMAHLKNLTILDLSGNQLEDLALQMENLQEMSASGNKLKRIPNLEACGQLKSIDLGENNIETIPEGAFDSQLESLYALRLSGNNIATITNTTFGNMSNLHMLNLAYNRLEAIPQGTFDGLQQLRGLRLDNNALVDLNGIVASLGRLQWLNVSSNGLEWFDYAFIPHSLEWLDISHNDIGELGNFYNLRNFNLHTLEAGHNRVAALDDSALPAKKLQFVQLQHNAISTIEPHTLAELAYLHSVDLRHNQIRGLSKESLRKSIQVLGAPWPQVLLHGNPLVCDCHLEWLPSINEQGDDNDDDHVRVADLADLECQLNHEDLEEEVALVTRVPEGSFLCTYTTHCFDLCRCCDFYACDCRMQCPSGCTCQHDATWSTNIIKCSNQNQTNIPLLVPMDATELYLDGNSLIQVGQQHFLGRQRLQSLYLNNSGITHIGGHAFSGLTSLKTLDLSYNAQLRELKGNEFSSGLANLRELRLDHCGLETIHEATFDSLVSLEVLRLDGNLLTSFPVWRLDGLQILTLAQNVWSCHCDFIAPFNKFLQKHIDQVLDYEDVQCVSENAVALNNQLCSDPQDLDQIVIEESNFELIAIVLPVVIVVCVLILGGLAVFVFRKHINKWLYAKSSEVYESRYNSSLGSSAMTSSTGNKCEAKLFDLYISYGKHDADFVDHNLAPTLEHGPRASTYRLCLHHRDFPADGSVYDTVTLASESSAKILIVLSKAFLAHEWPSVKTAILDSLRKTPQHLGEDRLVILCIDDTNEHDLAALAPELLPFTHNSVKWGSAGFLNKLRFFLPEPVHATFQRTVTLRSMQQQPHLYGTQSSEHVYHYIPENGLQQPPLAHVYQTLNQGASKVSPTLVLALQQSFENPVMNSRQLGVCHSHSLSTSSGQRLLTNPEEYIV